MDCVVTSTTTTSQSLPLSLPSPHFYLVILLISYFILIEMKDTESKFVKVFIKRVNLKFYP